MGRTVLAPPGAKPPLNALACTAGSSLDRKRWPIALKRAGLILDISLPLDYQKGLAVLCSGFDLPSGWSLPQLLRQRPMNCFLSLFEVMPTPADDDLDENDFDENFDEDFYSEIEEGLESELGLNDDVVVEGEGSDLDEDAVVPFEEDDDF